METTTRKYLTCIRNFLLISLPFLGYSTTLFSQTCEQDRAALIAFYEATNGAQWTDATNWLTDKPLGEWHGVTTINGCVTRLDLASNNLTGFIPPEIGNLENLKRLLLEKNNLTGAIPSQLGQLTSLEFLILNDNKLTGSIPSQLGNLSNLDDLLLFNNFLTGSIPNEIGKFPNLIRLFLYNNNLSGCFPDTLMVSDLNGLATYGNPKLPWEGDDLMYREGKEQIGATCDDSLTTTINDVIQVDCVCRGVLSCVQEDSIALAAFYNATDGANWENSNNWLSDRPLEEWFGITTNVDGCVIGLALTNNKLTGSIPSAIGALNNLEILNLDSNLITGSIPPAIGNLGSLQRLALDSNALTGSIPSELGNLTNLVFLNLSHNPLIDSIPAALGNLTNLQELFINHTNLTGSIPPELGTLSNLRNLYLNNNQLTGAIPSQLNSLTNLENLILEFNQLTGPIPPELGELDLNFLNLQSNQLSGCFPPSLIDLCSDGIKATGNPQLSWGGDTERFCNGEEQIGASCDDGNPATNNDRIIQDNCECKGELPLNPCIANDFEALKTFYESTDGDNWSDTTNWLSDAPLEEWFGITVNSEGCVTELKLHENGLNGSIPSTIGELDSLEKLIITYNGSLIGPIPREIGSLSKLEQLILEGNNLTEVIPTALGNLTNLQWLNLSNNKLSDSIPSALGILANLQELNLSSNKLSDSIPSALGNLSNLRKLIITINNLTGTIPSALGNLSNLETLSLVQNSLIGSIPPELGRLTNLQVLNLSNNDLSGCFSDSLRAFCPIINTIGNLQLPWRGDTAPFCNGEVQKGALCYNTSPNDVIQTDCSCGEIMPDCSTISSVNNLQNKPVCDPTLANITTRDTLQNILGCDSITVTNSVLILPPIIPSKTIAFDPTVPTDITLFDLADCSNCQVTDLSTNSTNCDITNVNGNILNCMPAPDNCDSLKVNFVVCKNICSSACDTATVIVYRANCEIESDCMVEDIVILPDSTFCEPFEYLGVLIQSDTTTRETLKNVVGCDSTTEINWVLIPAPTIPSKTFAFNAPDIPLFDLADCLDCSVTSLSTNSSNCDINDVNENVLNCTPNPDNCDSLKINFVVCKNICSSACDTATVIVYRADCELAPDCTNEEVVFTSDSTFCEPFEYLGVLIQSDTTTRETLKNIVGCDSTTEISWVFIPPPIIPSQLITFDPTTDTNIELTDCSDCRVTRIASDDIDETIMNLNGNMLNFPPIANTCDFLRISFEVCQMDCLAACTTATVTLYNQDGCEIPTTFTPNGDGIDDSFILPTIYDKQHRHYNFVILNRWGGQVYHADKYEKEGWNGQLNGTGKYLPDGPYFYLLRLDTEKEYVKGVVSLIR